VSAEREAAERREAAVQQVARAICENNCDPGFDQPHCDWDDCLRDAKIAVDIVWPQAREDGRRELMAEQEAEAQAIIGDLPEIGRQIRSVWQQGWDACADEAVAIVSRLACGAQPDEKERTDGQ
jgi:hypothetical protein